MDLKHSIISSLLFLLLMILWLRHVCIPQRRIKKNETTATGFPVVQTVFDNLLFHCTCCHLINCFLFVSDEIRFSAVAKKTKQKHE